MGINTALAGRRFGHLITAYGRGKHDVACRCVCGRLVHVAPSALLDGTITSCGCRPASPAFWDQQRQLRALLNREIIFNITRSTSHE